MSGWMILDEIVEPGKWQRTFHSASSPCWISGRFKTTCELPYPTAKEREIGIHPAGCSEHTHDAARRGLNER